MSKPTITVERLSFPPHEWYAQLDADTTGKDRDYRFHGETSYFGPLRATREQAKRDAKRLREWWKRRPR